ncbi:sensor histidine kinase [Lysinibacillus fusiformis]|uniref:sensor histidine kinase n=1 Tax=Lysinibacillus fusiformis TaxID=28031 RepID=UPI00215B3149|nr:ATP-binding protein [Lysinibacillus fusiformis]MCR8853871.1 histidine kinase [Lysinibacillus fusiformis]WKT76167.1 histidine kinase [Lysinibacillus fusiformis]
MPNKFFWPAIVLYIVLGLYLNFVNYSAPYIEIGVEEKDGKWLVSQLYYKDWAKGQNISIGDTILNVDDGPIAELNQLKYKSKILSANDLTIMKPDGKIINIHIKHLDIPQQFFYVLIVPACYYLLTLFVAFYLYFKQRNTRLTDLLILFILTVSLAYVSSGVSGRLDGIGIIVNRTTMLLCLVILLHFLRNYFSFMKTKWMFTNNIRFFYLMPSIGFILACIGTVFPASNDILSNVVLFLFLILLIIILSILLISYFKYSSPQLKILLSSIIIPFLPFLFLYVLPKILFHTYILSSEISSLFLLLIPFSFIFTQLAERLFDIEYHITRLRYYVIFSLLFTLWFTVGLYFIAGQYLRVTVMSGVSFFTFSSLVILFYVKEKVDYRKRKILFSTKGDYIHQLYTAVDKIGKTIKIDELLEKFAYEVSVHLELEDVFVLTYNYDTNEFLTNSGEKILIHPDTMDDIRLGEIRKIDKIYLAFLHQDAHYKRALVLGHNNTIHLKDEELLWLELLLLYVNNFIENTKLVEELLEELKHMKQADDGQLPWLNKLLWLRFEEEKYQLAQELHDTNLQEQLHIAREVDVLVNAKDTTDIQEKLAKIHKQMVGSLHELRTYCENLKPPLLDTLGLNAALEKLIRKVQERANFVLIYSIDRLYLEDERMNLMIYRLFQEVLNNALKHSYATAVEIHLKEMNDGFEIIYSDDGVGCHVEEIIVAESMGIRGMQERVKAFNGHFYIDSQLNQGMSIRIAVKEGSETHDYHAHSG